MPVHRQSADGVTVLTLSRPERRNALDRGMWHALREAAEASADARVVILTGEGPAFCAGLDLSPDNTILADAASAMHSGDETRAQALVRELKSCVQALADLPCPTLAAIEGACFGAGVELALACDIRIASEQAVFSLPEVRLGLVPDLGGCARLARLVGPGRAADLICTGRRVDAGEAHRLGLLERVVPAGAALSTARAAAGDILAGAPMAMRLALNVIRVAPDLGLDEALSVETRAGVLAVLSGEVAEGMAAAAARRAPRWGG
jgi:enoyl-CoA hydratase/carnithine racemase